MIRDHEFNSRWWGSRVGIVDDVAFFDLPPSVRSAKLAEYGWVEFKCDAKTFDPAKISASDFFVVDVQIPFRISLARIPTGPSMRHLQAVPASEENFSVSPEEMVPYAHERFFQLPSADAEKVARRYANWSNTMISQHPEHCLRITSGGKTQGWFLSKMDGKTIDLELAMLHKQSSVSGMYLYQKALLTYSDVGVKIGKAAFSVTNTAVHNIYSQLNARFSAPLWCWLWIRD